MAKVIISHAARNDLVGIQTYIRDELLKIKLLSTADTATTPKNSDSELSHSSIRDFLDF